MNTLHTMCITGIKEDLFVLGKKLNQEGFNIKLIEVDKTTKLKEKRLLIEAPKNKIRKSKLPSEADMELFKQEKGKYKGLYSMIILLMDDGEMSKTLSLLEKNKVKLVQLGYDGGWEGFPYYLIYFQETKEKLKEILKNNQS